jgi:DNA-binding PadR family transcriptional regulator
MTFKEKKIHVLKYLFEKFKHKYSDNLIEAFDSLKPNEQEIFEILKTLENDGLIDLLSTKDGHFGKILGRGVEFLEDIALNYESCSPNDTFSKSDKKEIIILLDDMAQKLESLDKGQELIYDDLSNEILELKQLLNVLGKKHWSQTLKGKLIDSGYGVISSEATKILIDVFSNNTILGS